MAQPEVGPIHGFELNYKNGIDIDVNGNTDIADIGKADFQPLATGINNITPANGATTTSDAYYDGGGNSQTDVTGLNISYATTGHRKIGDAAQDFVASKFYAKGDAVKTLVRVREQGVTGNKVGECTLTNIVGWGGAPNAKQTFSVTVNVNGELSDEVPAGK